MTQNVILMYPEMTKKLAAPEELVRVLTANSTAEVAVLKTA